MELVRWKQFRKVKTVKTGKYEAFKEHCWCGLGISISRNPLIELS
jgi:hypothetical protein